MSDLASAQQLAPAASQFPVAWYFDEQLFEMERRLLFDGRARYVGHELMVPNVGDYHVLEGRDAGRVLVRSRTGVELLSNVCRHRQALMLSGRGHAEHIVCPIHRWTYDLSGKLLGAPHFPTSPCLDLESTPLTTWNGLLFAGAAGVTAEFDPGSPLAAFDFSGFRLHSVKQHVCHYNWKTFIEVYLEDYHVEPFHPGLGQFVTCSDLRWQFGRHHSLQTVGLNDRLARPGTSTYERWHKAVLDYYEGKPPESGAVWFAYYPGLMLEWYPHVLVVSTLIPEAPDRTLNVVEFYYPEDIALFEPEFVEAEQAAYMETAIEDDEIAERMDRGRHALWASGRSEVGPYQSPMEDGMRHFHEWYRREMVEVLR